MISLLKALARTAAAEAVKQVWKRIRPKKREMPERVKRDLEAQQDREGPWKERQRAFDAAKASAARRGTRRLKTPRT